MKAKALIPIFVVFALTACSSNESTSIPNLKFDGLRGNVSMTKESTFDAVEKFGEFVPDDLNQVIIVEYDNDGNQIKYGVYDADGDNIYKSESLYDDGLFVSRTSYEGYLKKKTVSRVVERKKNYVKNLTNEGEEDEHYYELFYNGLSRKTVDEEGNITNESKYDKSGRLIEWTSYSDGEINTRILRTYDKAGNLITETQYRLSYETFRAQYTYPEFDKKGNWVTRYTLEDGEVVEITKREISYR